MQIIDGEILVGKFSPKSLSPSITIKEELSQPINHAHVWNLVARNQTRVQSCLMHMHDSFSKSLHRPLSHFLAVLDFKRLKDLKQIIPGNSYWSD